MDKLFFGALIYKRQNYLIKRIFSLKSFYKYEINTKKNIKSGFY